MDSRIRSQIAQHMKSPAGALVFFCRELLLYFTWSEEDGVADVAGGRASSEICLKSYVLSLIENGTLGCHLDVLVVVVCGDCSVGTALAGMHPVAVLVKTTALAREDDAIREVRRLRDCVKTRATPADVDLRPTSLLDSEGAIDPVEAEAFFERFRYKGT